MKNLVFQVSIPKYNKEEYITKGFVKKKNFTYVQTLYDFSNYLCFFFKSWSKCEIEVECT